MMNDDRNDTEYICVTISNTVSNPMLSDIEDESDPTILHVIGEYHMIWRILSALVLFSYTCLCVLF